ncbi:DUF3224 domain-containing protein [Aquimonas voraii]|uniref:DUF3224 domain-containing protein n=1 Tax=Aquimonas voraii TaxID=265719 RepID=A0A1G6Y2N3_9GAMM|nr:DUF3224 domain-containing protein [Aquimonas voraii]SDD83987.1 Protein of unknown function [Aquimonas voraii]
MRQPDGSRTFSADDAFRFAMRASALAVMLCAGAAMPARAADRPLKDSEMKTISGRFEVKLTPEPGELDAEGIASFRLDKRYEGALTAEAKGLMTAHHATIAGSAGYVAIERVRGTLDGRSGSFVLQHNGLMWGETRQLSIEVIPDSAEGELAGLRGRMGIRIEDGAHFYDFEYSLPTQ